MKRVLLISVIAIVLLAACAQAESGQKVTVEDAWARPALNGQNSAIYFTIKNPTQQDDRLLRAISDVAQSVELHMSMMNAEGTMSMQPQESVSVPAGQAVEFKPGGLHVMLVGLKQDLKVGDMLGVTLQFENGGELQLEVPVQEMP